MYDICIITYIYIYSVLLININVNSFGMDGRGDSVSANVRKIVNQYSRELCTFREEWGFEFFSGNI